MALGTKIAELRIAKKQSLQEVADAVGVDLVTRKLGQMSYRCWRHEAPLFDARNFNLSDTDLFAGRTTLAVLAIPEEVVIARPLDGCTEAI